ncbi:MAG TPA: glycoside hydrolase family 27 protein [Bacillota bacterium]|nr:glycoside hydrolase family 27 protein [Bacillota bacterium]
MKRTESLRRPLLAPGLFLGLLLTIIFAFQINQNRVTALDNGLARTPPMGWNSWNYFAGNINEKLVREIADAMVKSGMRDAGYEYINIDDYWQFSRDENGVIVPEASKFPNGMKALADYVHSKGLKLGLYSDRGLKTCGGRPGSYGYEELDAKTYAAWGIDYLKYDNCNPAPNSVQMKDYQRMRDALLKCGRPIVFSICAWSFYGWAPDTGNLWRTGADISDDWNVIIGIIKENNLLAKFAGPGHWNDPDMLEVGNGGLSNTEYRAHFSMWCIMAAPLIAGNDLRNMTPETVEILTNQEVIAVDQDPAGIQGTKVEHDGILEVWLKPLGSAGGKEKAVALFNRDDMEAPITTHWDKIGITGTAMVRDLWSHKDLGVFKDSFTAKAPSHGVVMLKITQQKAASTPGIRNKK